MTIKIFQSIMEENMNLRLQFFDGLTVAEDGGRIQLTIITPINATIVDFNKRDRVEQSRSTG
jgi:hypothetical protein